MKRLATLCLVLLFTRPVLAVDDGDVSYVGGTVENLKEGSLGKLDTTSQIELVFVSSSVRLAIPYASIDSYDIRNRSRITSEFCLPSLSAC